MNYHSIYTKDKNCLYTKDDIYTKDCLYKVNIEYTKEKYNHLKKEFVEATIYYYIEQYKQTIC